MAKIVSNPTSSQPNPVIVVQPVVAIRLSTEPSKLLNGSDSNDTLIGGTGNDFINGGAGHSILIGGSGNDRIQGDKGADQLYGGNGADTFVYNGVGRISLQGS